MTLLYKMMILKIEEEEKEESLVVDMTVVGSPAAA